MMPAPHVVLPMPIPCHVVMRPSLLANNSFKFTCCFPFLTAPLPPLRLHHRGGKEVGRHVGSSRADLIGRILQIQQSLGVSPPQRPTTGAVPRPKIVRRV